jgi:hypothetical protein
VSSGIEAKNIAGYQGIEMFRRDLCDEVEFITILTFYELQNVIDFQGEDYERCYVPDAARRALKRWNHTAEHFEAVSGLHVNSSDVGATGRDPSNPQP